MYQSYSSVILLQDIKLIHFRLLVTETPMQYNFRSCLKLSVGTALEERLGWIMWC